MEEFQRGEKSIEGIMQEITDKYEGNSEKYIEERVLRPVSSAEMRVIIDKRLAQVSEYVKDPSRMPAPKGYPKEFKIDDLKDMRRKLMRAEDILTGEEGGFEKNVWVLKILTDTLTDKEQEIIESINLAQRKG